MAQHDQATVQAMEKRSSERSTIVVAAGFAVLFLLAVFTFILSTRFTAPITPPQSGSTPEADILRAQMEIQRQYDERLVNTVYWGLGSVITLAFGLAGFGVFYTVRQSDRERVAIQAEISATLRDQISQIKADLSAETVKSRQATVKWSEEMKSALTKAIEDGKRTAEQAANAAATKQVDSLKGTVRDIQYDVLDMKFDSEHGEAKRLEDKGYHGSALSHFIDMGEIAVKIIAINELVTEYFVSPVLDGFGRVLQTGYRPDANEIRKMMAILDSFPKEFNVPIGVIRRLLSA